MSDTAIRIPVDETTARIFNTVSSADQQKMEMLLRLRLRELMTMPSQSLGEIMDEIGRNAQTRGLTPEILEDLLRDE